MRPTPEARSHDHVHLGHLAKMLPVTLLSCPDYDETRLLECVDRCSREADLALRPGCKVLVKPNLVSPAHWA
jgi:uncharacterized protein (DUF362 family)